ncbi:MAG: N-acetylmuramoyl-L-alanine amidase [Bryobacteraceae bacterium]
MADPRNYQFNLPPTLRPAHATIPEQWYPGIREFWERSTSSRIFDPILGVKAVVIHATAGSNSAGAVSVMRDGKASFHWLVPDEDEPQHGNIVWACAPEARAAWHVRNSATHPSVNRGAGKTNHWSLGIEVVNAQTASDAFSDWQVNITADIVRYCWAKYPNLLHVVSHARLDPTRRFDPGANFPWARFKAAVLESPEEAPPPLVSAATLAEEIPAGAVRDGCCLG